MKSDLSLHKIYSSHMVFQRNKPLVIKGNYKGHETIQVEMDGEIYTADLNSSGDWEAILPSRDAGGPFHIGITAANERILLEDVYIGDIWLMSGQSNMQLPMDRVKYQYPHEFQQGGNSMVRYFTVPETYDFQNPRKDFVGGSWNVVEPETIPAFSAVSYFFASLYQKETGMAVGIINASVGGTPIQSWMSAWALKSFPEDVKILEPFLQPGFADQKNQEEMERVNQWYQILDQTDPGLQSKPVFWEDAADYSPAQDVSLPGNWQSLYPNPAVGSFWLRKEIDLSSEDLNEPATLWLGRIIDSDRVWINGSEVGNTAYQYPPRIYSLDKGILKEGRNIITVRVISDRGDGCFIDDKPYFLEIGSRKISLEGTWKILRGADIEAIPGGLRLVTLPVGLFNGMIAPLKALPIKGVVWYQGESNVMQSSLYHEYLNSFLQDWRSFFEDQNLPFVIAQLPLQEEASDSCEFSYWAEIREAQRSLIAKPSIALAVTLDKGEWNDIHPVEKKEVGYRLAAEALRLTDTAFPYPEMPRLKNSIRSDGKVILSFTPEDSRLFTFDQLAPGHLFGYNGKAWVSMKAQCHGNEIRIDCDGEEFTKIRYGWADNPKGANIYYGEDLPLSPFEINLS